MHEVRHGAAAHGRAIGDLRFANLDEGAAAQGRLFVWERHAVAQAQGTGHHAVEAALQRMGGLLDSIGTRVPHFLALPTIIAASEMIATIPRPLAELMQPVAPIRIFPVPVRLPRLMVEQFWHGRFHDDAVSRWVRALLPRAMQQVFASGPKGFASASD